MEGDWATYGGIAIFLEHAATFDGLMVPMYLAVTEFFSGVLPVDVVLEVRGKGLQEWARKALRERVKDRESIA